MRNVVNMRKGTFARRIRPESLRFTYVLRICLAKQAKLSTSSLGKMNHAFKFWNFLKDPGRLEKTVRFYQKHKIRGKCSMEYRARCPQAAHIDYTSVVCFNILMLIILRAYIKVNLFAKGGLYYH